MRKVTNKFAPVSLGFFALFSKRYALSLFIAVMLSSLQGMHGSYTIIKAQLNHTSAILSIINEAYAKVPYLLGKPRVTVQEIRDTITHPDKQMYLCCDEQDKECGTAVLDITDPLRPEMSLFAIDPVYQGKKIGELLINHIQSEVKVRRVAEHLYIKVIPLFQASLLAYYKRQGFVATGQQGQFTQNELERYIHSKYWNEIYFQIMRKKV